MGLDTAPVLTSWCDFGWSTPYYWDYGPNEYIYCNNGVVYVNGAWYQPAPVFYQQTVQMIDETPRSRADVAAQQEWLPLGVFAVTPDGLNEAGRDGAAGRHEGRRDRRHRVRPEGREVLSGSKARSTRTRNARCGRTRTIRTFAWSWKRASTT